MLRTIPAGFEPATHGVEIRSGATPGALWKPSDIEAARILPAQLPALRRIVVAIDPAVSNNENSDETGIIVAGRADDGHACILADDSLTGGTPHVGCKNPYVGCWAFFALTVIVLVLWVLGRGLYIGSDYRVRSHQDGSLFTVKICHDLFLNGTEDTAEYDFGGPGTYDIVSKIRCSIFR